MGDLKTTAEERAAPHWCADCGAWQPGRVCPVAGVLHREGTVYTASAYTHLRYCIDEGDDRVCHKDLRDALDELDQLVPERDTLRAECERLRGALRNVRDDYDCDGVGVGGLECRHCLARAALGEP